MKKVLLVDVDSKIPNLALMKISAYHKSINDIVGFNIGDPDLVYASIIFSKNHWKGNGIKSMYPDAEVLVGGSGFDLKKKLPDNIECLMPDYDIYPNMDYSLGFTSRGCVRNCPFCIVREKEGYFKPVSGIYQFWNPDHKKIVLLDNNILANWNHFKMVADQILEHDLIVDFNQGLDIRLINDQNAELLSKLRVKRYRFAWDNRKDEKKILEGIQILKDHNITHSLFYILVGYDSTKEDDLYRLNKLKELDQRAYVMRYRKNRFYNDLSAWANQQNFFMKFNFDQFRLLRHNQGMKINV